MLSQIVCLGQVLVAYGSLHDDSIVDLPNGDGAVRGLVTSKWRSFRGIPFAQPPLGPLRFLPPEPIVAWAPEVVDATDYKPNCAQSYYKDEPAWDGLSNTIDEDCLYLNVFTPGKRALTAGRVAVGLFVFGGGHYSGGANDQQIYAWQTAAEVGMIFVTFNYRLGVFGWLGSEQLRAMAKDGSTGNAGFLDQRLAFQWVQKNIDAFGGDASRVLLFGESSGAADVSAHMVSSGSQGLFQRAMMESGGFTTWSYTSVAKKQSNFEYLLDMTGCNASRPFEVQCLQAMPWWSLSKIVDKVYSDFPHADGWRNSSFAVTVDGVTLTSKVDSLGMQGRAAAVPVMIGCNENEGVAFLSMSRRSQNYVSMTMTEKGYIRWARSNFPEPWASRFLERYPVRDFTPFYSASNLVGDYVVRCATQRAMRFLTQPRDMGQGGAASAPVFAYRYTHDPIGEKLHSGDPCAIGAQGAFHGADIPFFFDMKSFFSSSYETELGRTMATYLRNFAWSGNPNVGPTHILSDLPSWPQFTNSTLHMMQLGTSPDGNVSGAGVPNRLNLEDECKVMDEYWKAGSPVPAHAVKCVSDDATTDENGRKCSHYDAAPGDCGKFDTHEFFAESQCCACEQTTLLAEAANMMSSKGEPNGTNVTSFVVSLPNGDGRIRGHGTKRWRSFRGVPFAEPPLGSLRFLPPQRKQSWHPRVLDATTFKANCIQSDDMKPWQANVIGSSEAFDEDCLYLNVFAPAPPRNATRRFPVTVYFNDFGGASDAALDLWQTSAQSKMVIVTLNSRLGVFGYLGGEEVREHSQDGSTGNAGILDQRLVLNWVQQNIEAFYGDKKRVLVFGSGHGAAHVSSHMVSAGSVGLFQRAMMSSGAFRAGGEQTVNVSQANFNFIAETTGCRAMAQVVECLQALPAKVLTDFLAHHPVDKGYVGQLPFPTSWTDAPWTATIDGVVLKGKADILARQGKVAQVPVILGSSHNAGTSIATQNRTSRRYIPMTMSEHAYRKWTQRNFPDPWATELLSTYPVRKFKPFWATADALTDYVFKCPTGRASRFLSQKSGPAIFEYNFAVNPVGQVRPADQYGYKGTPCATGSQGVAIGYAVLFFFRVQRSLATEYENTVASELLEYLRNFAWSGDPNVFPPYVSKKQRMSLTHWPAHTNMTREKLWIGMPKDGNTTVQNDTRGLSCELWHRYWLAGEPLPLEGLASSASIII